MLKKTLLLLLISYSALFHSQQLKIDSLRKDSLQTVSNWKIFGDNSLLVSQNAFSNWVSGGTNSFGITAKANYEFNYKKDKNIWKNKAILGYGQISNEGEKPRKTDDIISLSSLYGHQIDHNWYASVASTFLTQMANGYDYSDNPDRTPKDRKSSFMAPGYFTLGIGFDYKPEGNFQMSFLPITTKTVFVLDKKLQKKGNFGLRHDGDWVYLKVGPFVSFKYKTDIMKNIAWENYVSFFSNYITHSERIDLAYSTSFNMKVNNYISTKLSIDMLYEHDQVKKLQVKQALGVGFSYLISNKKK